MAGQHLAEMESAGTSAPDARRPALPHFLAPVASRTNTNILAAALICFAVLMPGNAYAYLDPGAGAFALQGLIAGIAGGVLSIRSYWKRIGEFFRSKSSAETGSERRPSDDDA